MPIASMTGFARSDGTDGVLRWTWEVKSVNGRNLDVRSRLAPGMEALEPRVRKAVGEVCRRGSVSVTLRTAREAAAGSLRLNREVADSLIEVLGALGQQVEAAPPTLDGLMRVPGLVELVERDESEEERERREAAMIASLREAVAALGAARRDEGAALLKVVEGQLADIEELTAQARETAAAQPETLKARLKQQVEALLEASPALPEERLAQEAALLATKADVREELDRLAAHVEAAREMLKTDGAIGRRLDFLAQEFNREANTLCSKSSDVTLTRVGLELKARIEQFREQVQNIE